MDGSKSVSSDSFGQLKIFRHNSHSLGMNSAKVSILEKGNQISLSSFLKSQHGLALESYFLFPFLGNLTDHPLEWQFSDQQIGLKYKSKRK